ncbi:MAG: helix-turn-helix transcriptional regulator [Verrucomicrobia bacterium]|nr:helix-turn-helix transcriptional regulator [Verrucomicrobiota bacterium]
MKNHKSATQWPLSKRPHLNSESALARMGDGEVLNARQNALLPLPPHLTQEMTSAAIAVIQNKLNLTPRQSEVLYWMAEGKTNEEISIILECSFFTVKSHAKAIFRLLQVDSRTAAAAFAHRAYAKEQS